MEYKTTKFHPLQDIDPDLYQEKEKEFADKFQQFKYFLSSMNNMPMEERNYRLFGIR